MTGAGLTTLREWHSLPVQGSGGQRASIVPANTKDLDFACSVSTHACFLGYSQSLLTPDDFFFLAYDAVTCSVGWG